MVALPERSERYFATLERELLERRRFASQVEARMACFSFIEGFYNPHPAALRPGVSLAYPLRRGDANRPTVRHPLNRPRNRATSAGIMRRNLTYPQVSRGVWVRPHIGVYGRKPPLSRGVYRHNLIVRIK